MFPVVNLVEIFDVYITYHVCTVLIKKEGQLRHKSDSRTRTRTRIRKRFPSSTRENPLLQGSEGSWGNLWETEELKKEGLICSDMQGLREHYAQ